MSHTARKVRKEHHGTTIRFHGAAREVTPSSSTLTKRTKESVFRIMTDAGSAIREETADAQNMR